MDGLERVRVAITGAFGVLEEIDYGRILVDFCAERRPCVGNTYFEHKNLHKYTRVAMSQDRVEVKSMATLVLVKKDKLCYVHDVRTVR